MNDFDLIHCLVSASIHLFHFHITTVFTSFNLILLSLLRSSSWEPVSISQFLIPVFQHIVLPFRPAFMPHYSSSSHLLPRPENLFQGLNQPSANSALVPESRLRGHPISYLRLGNLSNMTFHQSTCKVLLCIIKYCSLGFSTKSGMSDNLTVSFETTKRPLQKKNIYTLSFIVNSHISRLNSFTFTFLYSWSFLMMSHKHQPFNTSYITLQAGVNKNELLRQFDMETVGGL